MDTDETSSISSELPEETDGWGGEKDKYYDADVIEAASVADSEDAAVEEENEAKLMQQRAIAQIKDEDFMDLGLEGEEHDEIVEQVQKITKDPSLLSKEEKLRILVKESPELLQLIEEFKASLAQIRNQIQPVIDKVDKNDLVTKDGMSYLEVKHHLLLSYCTNIAFYLLLKANSAKVEDHPVVDRLVEIRTVLERLKPIDQKLKYQIDKLVKKSVIGDAAVDAKDPLQYKAKIDSLIPRDSKEEQNEEEEEMQEKVSGDQVYKPPKLAAMPYVDEKEKEKKEEERMEKKRKSLAKGRVARELLEEFSEKPIEETMGVVSSHGQLEEESESEVERRKFEEEHFIRLDSAKKKKKKRKLNEVTDDFGDFGKIEDLTRGLSLPGLDDDGGDDEGLADFLKKQVKKNKDKKEGKRSRKEKELEREYKEEDDHVDGKRTASYKMLKNKGMTGNRKNPIARVKHKNKFKKAQTKRRTSGIAKVVKPLKGSYSGESTGIKKGVVRSTRY